jgi:hypothetical protein
MTTKYKIKRYAALRGMRTRREFIYDLWSRAKAGVEIAVGLLLLLAVFGWMQERDLRDAEADAITQAQEREAKAHKMLAHVLNGRSLIDHKTGDVFFVQVSRQEGL